MPTEGGFVTKLVAAHKDNRLKKVFFSRVKKYSSLAESTKYILYNPSAKHITFHCPSLVAPDPADLPLVKRIHKALQKMQEDRRIVDPLYLPSSMWQGLIDKAYASLAADKTIEDFHYFLANFGSWDIYNGIESTAEIRASQKSILNRLHLQNAIYRQLKIWRWFNGNQKPMAALNYPQHGNQTGFFLDGIFAGRGSFFNEIYGSLLSSMVSDRVKPVVADLGGGYGKLAHFTLRHLKNFTFIDFDLPEVLTVATYYLMKSFPDKKFLLYGEGSYSASCHKDYDFILMPSWEIANVGVSTVDLFMNKNSLGEMTQPAVRNYIKKISDATRYFFHMNHDSVPNIFADGQKGLLGYQYPIPMDQFKLLFRGPDLGHLLSENYLDFNIGIFAYLYERRCVNKQ
jgi:hypothetical protein